MHWRCIIYPTIFSPRRVKIRKCAEFERMILHVCAAFSVSFYADKPAFEGLGLTRCYLWCFIYFLTLSLSHPRFRLFSPSSRYFYVHLFIHTQFLSSKDMALVLLALVTVRLSIMCHIKQWGAQSGFWAEKDHMKRRRGGIFLSFSTADAFRVAGVLDFFKHI